MRSHTDELGMGNVHLKLEPHVGTPIVANVGEALMKVSYGDKVDWGVAPLPTPDGKDPAQRPSGKSGRVLADRPPAHLLAQFCQTHSIPGHCA